MIVLVIGGARSGKSRFAQTLAQSFAQHQDPGAHPEGSLVYLATSRPWDDDHRARIARHRQDRDDRWTTLEEDRHPSRHPLAGRVVVLDCLTLFLTNVFADHGYGVEATLREAKDELTRTLAIEATWIVVTNELGSSLHASTESGRKFVDLQGWINQHVAGLADTVVLMVAGLPLVVKGALPPTVTASNERAVHF